LEAAQLDVDEGRFATAIDKLRAVIPKLTAMLSATDIQVIFARAWLSTALLGTGQHQRSEDVLLEAQRFAQQSKDSTALPNIEIVMARHYLRTQQPGRAEPFIRSSLEYFKAAGLGGRQASAMLRSLHGELLVRSNRLEEALPALEQARAEQRAIAGKAKYLRGSYLTLTWYAIAMDTTAGAAAADRYYIEARDAAARFRVPDHPDRLRLQLLVDYAAWRNAKSGAARVRLLDSLRSYKRVLQQRADFATFSVLEKQLLQDAAPTRVFGALLSLMNY
jgi:hypothetical protein